MTAIVVAGVTSLYAAAPIGEFPLEFQSLRYPSWLHFGVGGVGFHVSRVLSSLGDDVTFCTAVGDDPAGMAIRDRLRAAALLGRGVVTSKASSTGVVLVADNGSRTVLPHLDHVRDLDYPIERFAGIVRGADLAVLTNIDFVRPLLSVAGDHGVPIAADVHQIGNIGGGADRVWLEHAQVLFCSHEKLPCTPVEWVRQVLTAYRGVEVVVVGCGADGNVLGTRCGKLLVMAAVAPLGVSNTTGAGDALFASFIHVWTRTRDVVHALRSATVYAGWKVGHRVPGESFISGAALDELVTYHPTEVRISRL